MKVLITGGAGFIGQNLILFLSKFGQYELLYCDNEFSSTIGLADKGCQVATKVASDFAELTEEHLRGVDALIHLAAVKKHNALGVEDEQNLIRTNIIETQRLFQLAQKSGVKNIIFASSLYANGELYALNAEESAYPKPSTLYGNSKLFGEGALREFTAASDMSSTVLRLYFIYGPRQYTGKGYPSVFLRSMVKMKNGQDPIIVNDGKQRLDYMYIDDLCMLIEKIISKPKLGFNIVNASSGEAYTINTVVSCLSKEWNSRFGTSFVPIYSGNDFTQGTYRSGNNALAKKTWDWTPQTSLQQGVKYFVEWFVENNSNFTETTK